MKNKLRKVDYEAAKISLKKEIDTRSQSVKANNAINSRLSSYGSIGLGMYMDYITNTDAKVITLKR